MCFFLYFSVYARGILVRFKLAKPMCLRRESNCVPVSYSCCYLQEMYANNLLVVCFFFIYRLSPTLPCYSFKGKRFLGCSWIITCQINHYGFFSTIFFSPQQWLALNGSRKHCFGNVAQKKLKIKFPIINGILYLQNCYKVK